MEWIREGRVDLPMADGLDAVRALRPSVVEDGDGTLRMWYAGNDGETSRILGAVRRTSGSWEPLGVAIDVGAVDESDSYAAESPCVVATPGGYLMVYGGFDGEVERCIWRRRTTGVVGSRRARSCNGATTTQAGRAIPGC